VRLEIGFGGAEHLIEQARNSPHTGFIGSDAFVNGVAKALAAIDTYKLDNVRLHHGDASALIDWLPRASIARVDLLYPDPWPKRRHWKRRFIQDESLKRLARILEPGGELRFATDIGDYAAYALTRVLRSPDLEWTAERADDWRKPWPEFFGTRYEAKAKREGRTPSYFIFRKL
jgi:tRNA (guanine-N7-)-methyltransferase